MVVNSMNPPAKPKRRYLPLSLSFDDGEERRRRYQQRLRNQEANEKKTLHNSAIDHFAGTYASVILNNRKVEIPYIDADPHTAAIVLNLDKGRPKPRRNHTARPSSAIITTEEIVDMKSSFSSEILPNVNDLTNSISPTVITYAEWKRKFTSKKRQHNDALSTPNKSSNEIIGMNPQKPPRRRMSPWEIHEANPDSSIQLLKKKVSRSKSSQPPNVTRRHLNENAKCTILSHTEEDANDEEMSRRFQRCNSESNEATVASEIVTSEKRSRTRAKLLKRTEDDSQCSNSSNGYTERTLKNSLLSSAGKFKSAFSRSKKQQQHCDNNVYSNANAPMRSMKSKTKIHSVPGEVELIESATQNMAISPKINTERNKAMEDVSSTKLPNKDVSSGDSKVGLNGAHREFQGNATTNTTFTTMNSINITSPQQTKKELVESDLSSKQFIQPFMEWGERRERHQNECAKIQQRRPTTRAACNDFDKRIRARSVPRRPTFISNINNENGYDIHKRFINSTKQLSEFHTTKVSEIAKIFSK